MAIQFILGRSGTGKTHHCIRAITQALQEDASVRLIFLVPEQATFQIERGVLAQSEVGGFDRLSILSFDRLHYQLLGGGGARKRLSAVGRQMALHRIIHEQAGQLNVYRSCIANPGFVIQVMRTIDQLQRYANGPEDLARCIEHLQARPGGALCAAKLQDIQVLLRAYLQFIEGRFFDPVIEFNHARGAIKSSPLLNRARLWVDGFSGFTRSEFLMLEAMLATVSEAHIALCLDPEYANRDMPLPESDPLDLFAPTWETFRALREMVRTLKLCEAPPVLLTEPHRFARSRALAHIERNLFASAVKPIPASQSVVCGSAANERHEVLAIARQIRRMVAEQGMRYRDIAVIAADLNRYEHYIQASFSDYDLPYFMDKQHALVHHPCATLICTALRMARSGFDSSEVLAYLRTGLTPLESQAIDRLENYCLAFGIRARDWVQTAPWALDSTTDPLFDEQCVNRTRQMVMKPLLALRRQFFHRDKSRPVTGRVLVQAIRTLLEQLQVARALDGLIQAADRHGEPAAADMHRQFWDWLCAWLDECEDTLGSYHASLDFFVDLLHSAFAQMTMALIPPCLDQILVGSIERSRHPDLKVVFLLGTTQKQFPAPLPASGLLSETEREHAALAGLCLDAGLLQTLSQRRYLAYIAFTRPSARLIVTYPLSDEKGNAVVRSQFVDDLEQLFDDLCVRGLDAQAHTQTPDGDMILCQHELTDWVCSQGHTEKRLKELDVSDPWRRFYHALRARKEQRAVHHLGRNELLALYGSGFVTSASQLGSFAACPYQFFAHYTLGLKPRKELILEPLDLGNLYHRVLEHFVETMRAEDRDWGVLETPDLLAMLDQVIEQVLQDDPRLRAFMRHSPTNAFVIRGACDVLHVAVQDLVQMMRAGQFRPVFTEAAFGTEDRELGDFEIDLPGQNKVALQGKVDRIDLAGSGAHVRALVFDYKRRMKTPDWARLFHGLDLQLGIYMLALRNARKQGLIDADVVGAFFLPLEVKVDKAELNDPATKLKKFKRKARGLFVADIAQMLDPLDQGESQFYNFYKKKDGTALGNYNKRGSLKPQHFERVLDFVGDMIRSLSQAIMAGEVVVRPCRLGSYTPCKGCPYRPLCRFDGQVHEIRYLQARDKAQVLEALEAQYGE